MSIRFPLLLALTLLVTTAPRAAAQTTQAAPCGYETCAVRHTIGFFGERLVRGASSEEVVKINFSGSNAVDYLTRVEGAAAPAREFRTRRTRAAILGLISAAAVGYFTGFAFAEGDDTADPTSTEYAILFGGAVTGIFAGVEASRSRNSLSRAIWEFNRAPVP